MTGGKIVLFAEKYSNNRLANSNASSCHSSHTACSQARKAFSNKPLLVLFFLGLLFLLVRAEYGFCFNDEPFCVTLGQRLYNGDALIAEEWHGCQLFSAIILPFYSFFRLFSANNTGILLFLRHCYCILWWLCCIYVSVSLAKQPMRISLVFFFLLFFSPLDYMTISYTSISLMSVLVVSCILYKIPTDSVWHSIPTTAVFALLWAMIVLCSPFMIAGYIGLLIMALAGAGFEKKKGSIGYFCNLASMFRYAFIIDCVLAVIYVGCFLLVRTDLSTIFESIPHIFADPEHQSFGIGNAISALLRDVWNQGPLYLIVSFITFLCAPIIKNYRIRSLVFGVNAILFAYCQIDAITTPFHFNVQMLHIFFLGAVAFSLLRKKDYKLFFCFYSMSCCFALLNGLASNTGIMTISMAATVAGCAAMVFIVQLGYELAEQYQNNKLLQTVSALLICSVVCLQITSEVFVKLTRQYWDSPPYQLTETISCGAAKGLRTTPAMAHMYTSNYLSLTHLLEQVDTTDKKFLSCTSAPYLYLDADLDFATFSAWSFGYGNGLNSRLLTYQQVNPGNTADIIYCASEEDILPLIDETYTQYEYDGKYLFVKDLNYE